jgi:hypothetical protein
MKWQLTFKGKQKSFKSFKEMHTYLESKGYEKSRGQERECTTTCQTVRSEG